jgi:hypothetical protein
VSNFVPTDCPNVFAQRKTAATDRIDSLVIDSPPWASRCAFDSNPSKDATRYGRPPEARTAAETFRKVSGRRSEALNQRLTALTALEG